MVGSTASIRNDGPRPWTLGSARAILSLSIAIFFFQTINISAFCVNSDKNIISYFL